MTYKHSTSKKCHQDAIEAVKAIMPDIPLSIIEHDTLFIADAVQSKVKETLDEKKKNASVETNTGEHCTETCPEGGVETGDMVRCCLCFIWFHYTCVNTTNKDTESFWSCPACRCLAQNVACVLKEMHRMTVKMDCVEQRLKEKENEYRDLKRQMSLLSDNCSNMKGMLERIIPALLHLEKRNTITDTNILFLVTVC